MNNTQQNIPAPNKKPEPKRRRRLTWLKWIAIFLAVVIIVPILLILSIPVFLTSDRLTELVNREASEYLNADIHANNVDYSLWSTFPRFKITTGKITVISRTLRDISPEIRKVLPDSADYLGSLKSFSGEINVVDLFLNRYVIHDVQVDGLDINLVAYNDSVNNYDILPSTGENMKRVPYIRANRIVIKDAGRLSYYSASTNTKADMALSDLELTRLHGKKIASDTYRLQLGGKVTASSAGLHILNNFPFSLGGNMRLRFNPFRVEMSDYGINLGSIRSRLSMSVGVGDDPRIESFDYKINTVSIAEIMGYIPREFLPPMQGIKADMQISASARLLSSWSFSSETFPSIAVDFKIPEGNISYSAALPSSGNQKSEYARINLHHSGVDCDFVFNGEHPARSYIRIPDFYVVGEGVSLGCDVLITRLTTTPHVEANVDINSNLSRTLRAIPIVQSLTADGNVNVSSNINFDIDDLSKSGIQKGVRNLSTSAFVNVPRISFDNPEQGIKGVIDNLQIAITESTQNISSTSITNPSIQLTAALKSGKMDFNGDRFSLDALTVKASSSYKGAQSPAALRSGVPVSISGEIGKTEYFAGNSDFNLIAGDIKFGDSLHKRMPHTLTSLLNDGMNLSIAKAILKGKRNSIVLHDADIALSLAERGDVKVMATGEEPTESMSSDHTHGLPHTPEYIKFDIPAKLRQFITDFAMESLIKVKRIDLDTKGLNPGNYLANLDLKISDDDVTLDNLEADVANTRARMNARIYDLRPFLLNPASEKNPLKADLNMALDTININALAKAYVVSKGGMKNIPRHDTVTADDSTALMLPRNLQIGMNLTALETLYTNLELYNLDADIRMRNGVLDIPQLSLGSDFGKAALNVRYAGADIDSLGLNLGVDIQEIDIVKFFKKFHSLLVMMPEMKNLSGFISADATMEGKIFPDMYINVPSAEMEATIRGRQLTVHQSDFIRKITKMMLIETDDDLHIANMDVHAEAHDNLLQLDPFIFEFDRYKLQMLGINNFNGKLYYHIDVEKSPVPFPFSINIEGMFRHPKLRFGGPRYNLKKAEEITASIQEENKMNMTKVLKQLLRAFIGKAAESAPDNSLAEN